MTAADYQRFELTGRRAKRHAKSELAGSLGNAVGNDAMNPERG